MLFFHLFFSPPILFMYFRARTATATHNFYCHFAEEIECFISALNLTSKKEYFLFVENAMKSNGTIDKDS